MASDDVALDTDSILSDQPLRSSVLCKPVHKSKRRGECYFYVSAGSAEADTLKDRFWRDLDQGKIAFDRTEDLYTRVKRGAKKVSPVALHLNISISHDATPRSDNSAGYCLAAGSSYSSASATVVDASTPASSGYDSSSIPSVDPVTAADSPAELVLSESILDTSETNNNKSARDGSRKWRNTLKRAYSANSTSASRRVVHQRKRARRKFYDLVDASSAAADTLKDKFWRDLDTGKVKVTTTNDLYSSVKVSRSERTRAVSISIDTWNNSEPNLTVAASSVLHLKTDDSSFCQFKGSGSDEIKWLGSDVQYQHRENEIRKSSDISRTGCQRISDDNIDSWHAVTDSKLQSPCAVSVERLSWSYSWFAETAGLSNRAHLDEKAKSCTEKVNLPLKLKRSRIKRTRLMRTELCHTAKSKTPSKSLVLDIDHSTAISDVESPELLSLEGFEIAGVNDNVNDCSLMICVDPERPCCSLLSSTSWCTQEEEPICVISKGSLTDLILQGDCSSVRLMLNHSSLPIIDMLRSTNRDDMTPLMIAASLGHCDIIDVLVQKGADVNYQSNDGNTALMIACEKGFERAVNTLLKFGAQTELRTRLCETALMKAVRSGHSNIVVSLLSNGADTTVISRSHETVCSIARGVPHLDYICNILDCHILRRVNALHDAINSILRGVVTIVDALFPLRCFSLSEVKDQVRLKFQFSEEYAPSGTHALLFIGHSLMGVHSTDCRLHGHSSVTSVELNGVELVPLGKDQFIFLCQPCLNNNELVLNLQDCPSQSKVKLLVCAYFIQPSSTINVMNLPL